MQTTLIWAAVLIGALAVFIFWSRRNRGEHPFPDILRPGKSLPEFRAFDEQGNPLRSTQLTGTLSVILFVRGGWCPFCNEQVENLTAYYKDITDLGARLILVTPKPLETTRRVARFFEVEFEFWLDESLDAAEKLGLLHTAAVPEAFRTEYGRDTVWPAALVVDRTGVIRYAELSKHVSDRPDPEVLLKVLREL
ncbi:MAG: redoxin domain-containing protein [Woeseiaceae bacterium]